MLLQGENEISAAFLLVFIFENYSGIASTIGAGVYILMGTVAREHSCPALVISFLIVGIVAALSAFCYAELASRYSSAGSAYHYSYICVREGLAWIIGWALILEYTIRGSVVARGISPNLALLFGGPNSLPAFLARQSIPSLGIAVDLYAAILVFVVTGLLCVGIKESTFVQSIVTTANICAMIFVIVAGGYLGFKNGWVGYKLSSGYFSFGVDGMLAGASTFFFSYIGFDSIASTVEKELSGDKHVGSKEYVKTSEKSSGSKSKNTSPKQPVIDSQSKSPDMLPPNVQQTVKCSLSYPDVRNIVARGTLHLSIGKQDVRGVPLQGDYYKVSIDEVIKAACFLPFEIHEHKTVGDAQGSFVALPKHLVKYKTHVPATTFIKKSKKYTTLEAVKNTRSKTTRSSQDVHNL